MAKAKSKKITLEEALVPVEEQPYEVPENWCWVKLSYIADIRTGRKDANYGNEDGEYYFLLVRLSQLDVMIIHMIARLYC